ncbi:hypothetical protein [Ponticoccus alexandrii]|nr:hypothetical protein [Ponticoccus alexandrii]
MTLLMMGIVFGLGTLMEWFAIALITIPIFAPVAVGLVISTCLAG